MTHLFNDPKHFVSDSLRGLVDVYAEYVQPVHGGVVRSTASPSGEVAIVVGGGSGHYPAFAGWVGPGMAHGAVTGNIFASPSASQVISVSRQSDNGGGVILLFGNYAGDVLHFGQAAEELNEDGIDTRIITISDDIASNPPEKHNDRRGIAGDFTVIKVAGAAAAAGKDLEDVVRITTKANQATRSLGVAFSGCTLPGADEPLFTVPEGQYALGLGVHGEPGISMHDLSTAREIAELLVDSILEEEPEVGPEYNKRVALLVNGLGATKWEELFLLYADIADLLRERGIEIVSPVVDEQITSLDMAGASLTLMFLDDELEECWLASADTPAFRTGTIEASAEKRVVAAEQVDGEEIVPGAPESQAQARSLSAVLSLIADTLIQAEQDLGKLDSIAGDGDHGLGMVLGSTAARDAALGAVQAEAGAKTMMDVAGAAWAEGAGGTSGALWGAALKRFAREVSDDSAAGSVDLGRAAAAAAANFAQAGGAKPGDKTMVDASTPFAESLSAALDAGDTLEVAWVAAAEAAQSGADATADMVASKGRARTHGEKSLGHPDPGAVSFALLMRRIGEELSNGAE